MIAKSLKGKEHIKLTGRTTNLNQYPIGTVARISYGRKRAYFLAEADINEEGIPINTDASNIVLALVSLWDYLIEHGNQEYYSIPLLGTGRAGVGNLSREDIIKEIVLSFIMASKDKKITENLIICIHPCDFEKIDWDEVCEYLTPELFLKGSIR